MADIDAIITTEGEADMDTFKTVEYDRGRPKALVEYKHIQARDKDKDISNPNNRTLATLASMAGIPAFLVIYDPDALTFRVRSMNFEASEYAVDVVLSEGEYQEFLREVRR